MTDAERLVDEFLKDNILIMSKSASGELVDHRANLIVLVQRGIDQVGCSWPGCADFAKETQS